MSEDNFLMQLGVNYSPVIQSLKDLAKEVANYSKKLAAIQMTPNFDDQKGLKKAKDAAQELALAYESGAAVIDALYTRLGQDIQTKMLAAGQKGQEAFEKGFKTGSKGAKADE